MTAFPVGQRELEQGETFVARHEALHGVGVVEEFVAPAHPTAIPKDTSVQTPRPVKMNPPPNRMRLSDMTRSRARPL